jgi:hypothetical protein
MLRARSRFGLLEISSRERSADAGAEPLQFDALFSMLSLGRQPLVPGLAGLAGDEWKIETVIRVKRTA